MRRLATVVLCVCIAACASPIHVTTDYDPGVDFTRYETFDWLPDAPTPSEGSPGDSDLMRRRVERALCRTPVGGRAVARHRGRRDGSREQLRKRRTPPAGRPRVR